MYHLETIENMLDDRSYYRKEEVDARLKELHKTLERAGMWLGKMIADGRHMQCVMPKDAENTLARINQLLDKGGK